MNQVRDVWDRLICGMSRARFLHFRQWYESYLHALEPRPDDLVFCVVHDPCNAPAALLPLKQETRKAGPIKVRTLELPRHEHLFLRDILVSDSARSAVSLSTLTRLLRSSELKWDILCLWHVLDDSCTMAAYRLGAPRFTVCAPRAQCFWIPAEPWDDLIKRFHTKFRQTMRKARRRGDELGTLTYRAVTTMPELEQACDEFMQVESSGWKGAAGTGTAIGLDPRLVEFYKDLARRFAEHGRCHIHVLRDGDKPIAAQFALLDQTTVYTLKTGYDESYSRISPGHLLDQGTFEFCANIPGVKAINFASDAPYLEMWKPQRMAVHNLYAFHRTPIGLAAAAAMKLGQLRKPAGS
jgi:hypothetical protein